MGFGDRRFDSSWGTKRWEAVMRYLHSSRLRPRPSAQILLSHLTPLSQLAAILRLDSVCSDAAVGR